MKIYRIYIDSSVIGGYEDDEFSEWSKQLIDEIILGVKIGVISPLTEEEISAAPDKVKEVMKKLNMSSFIEKIDLSEEAEKLANKYIAEGVVNKKSIIDAYHIALATVNKVDILASWNFKHIVNINRIHGYNAVNLKEGYGLLEIRSPREVLNG